MPTPAPVRNALLMLTLLCCLAASTARAQTPNAKPAPTPTQPAEPAPPPVAVFRLRYEPPRIIAPVIQASINGAAPENFVLDTGAGYPVVLTEAYARRAKLSLLDEQRLVNETAPVKQAQLASLHLIALSGARVPIRMPDKALVLPNSPIGNLAPGERIAGIIGIGAFSQNPTVFDFKAQTLSVHFSRKTFTPPSVAPLPLYRDEGGVYETDVEPARGIKTRMILDTGAFRGNIDQAVLNKLPRAHRTTGAGGQLQGIYFLEAALVSRFAFGGKTVEDVGFDGVPAPLAEEASYLLGMQVMQFFRMTWDCTEEHLYVEWNPAKKERIRRAISGAYLARDKDKVRVVRVVPRSPTARVGLQVGDEVVSVDGIAALPEEAIGIDRVLDGEVGTEACVEVRRKSLETLRFRRKDFTPPQQATPWFQGIVGRVLNGKPFEVFELDETAPAFRAGLRAGEQITTVNDQEVARLTQDGIYNLLLVPQVTLIVRGKNNKTRTVVVAPPSEAKKR